MFRKGAATAIAALMLASSPTAFASADEEDAFAHAVSICAVVADVPKYDGQFVFVTGVVARTPHETVLWGPSCPHTFARVNWKWDSTRHRQAVSMFAPFLRGDGFRHVEVVFRATFRIIHPPMISPDPYQVDAFELVAARDPPVRQCSENDQISFRNANVTNLHPIVSVAPRYPAGEDNEGWVELLASLNEGAYVHDVCILEAQPVNRFEQSAATAIRRWRYNPADVAWYERLKVRIEFRLQ